MTQDALHSTMASVEVVVNVSASEGCSNAILEAMALSRPIVARNIPGNASVLTHGETGLLFEDEDGYLQALHSVLADPEYAAQLGKAARRCFEAKHTPAMERSRYVQLACGLGALRVGSDA